MISNNTYYELFASYSTPDHNRVGYWVDLGANSEGKIIKTYNNNLKKWVKVTDATSEDAVAPFIGNNGNWWIENRDTGVSATGARKAPIIGENGNWFEFDDYKNKYVDTGNSSRGVPGEQGPAGNSATINGFNAINIVEGENITIEQSGNTLIINGENGGGVITETDPIFSASPAANITDEDISTWNDKQDKLVSGVNLKTINGASLLGEGNILIEGGGGGGGGASIEYASLLKTSLAYEDIVIVDDEFLVPLNFRAVKVYSLGNVNLNLRGTLVIERSIDNGTTFDNVAVIPNLLRSENFDNDDVYTDVDLGKYLIEGKQMLRARATFECEDELTGAIRTVNSSWVSIGNSINKTKLELILRTDYEIPMQAFDGNNNPNKFSVMYTVNGSVSKILYVKIDNGSALKYELGPEIDSTSYTVSISNDTYMTHGVHKVEAWLECKDGLGNTLKSDVLVNRFMMVNQDTPNADFTKPYLLLQNISNKKEIENFVQTSIAEYAVYSPSGESINVAFLLTGYAEKYEEENPEQYFRLDALVEPRKKNSLLTTIEIETKDDGTEILKYDTYFRVRRISGETESDFMKESTGETNYYVIVNNNNSFTPVSGATFLINPKLRNNSEEHPDKILNEKDNNAEVHSVWTNFGFINDGWMIAEDGQKVLRVMAGSTLEITKNVWAQFLSNPKSSLTIEIDCKISNVTNLTDPIIQMFDGTVDSFKGLKMNALEGWLMNGSNQSKDNCLFAWQEDVRTHFAINLNHQVIPNKGDVYYPADKANLADGSLALARVLINGDCVREMTYNVDSATEWCSSEEGSIIIGNEGADIDIYSIRIYENRILEMTEILNRNYLSSLPTAEEKMKLFNRNNLLDAGKISLTKARDAGLNCMIWHGVLPYHENTAEQKGWVEIFRYDQDGKPLPEYSGKICEKTKSLVGKGQGSTAKTYYDWNLQEDSSKVKETIQVSIDKIHPEIYVSEPYTGEDGNQYVDIYGGHLGKNAPIEIPENAQPYPYTNGFVTVPDGWIDGNGMYRGMGYRVAEGTSLAQKRVIKINYASSMQSHLIGACNTYDLLHRRVVGDTPLQQVIPDAVSAKRTEPFMFFNEVGGGTTYFKGMGTYGAAKADKVTWGFVKKQMPMYALIEGSDNNLPMTGFRVPFDKNTAFYDVDGEGWTYNGQQSFDFDLGNTFEPTAATESDGWQYKLKASDNEAPTALIRDKWADIHNFIYLHSTNLKYYNGTFEDFLKSDKANDTNYKYWCTASTDSSPAFHLYRYDYSSGDWIKAGLSKGGGSYSSFDLTSSKNHTGTAYNRWVQQGTGDFNLLNNMFIQSLVDGMKKYLKFFINEKSLLFNYCYVLGFLAGTDNSDKNTYYKIMPYAEDMGVDEEFNSWFYFSYGRDFDFTSVHQLYFDGDDMDSIFRTNNNSHQTKPYYIDRMHPSDDANPNVSLYEGMGNQLFNFVEKAYESTGELASVMKEILNAATKLVSEDDKLLGLESNKRSLWGFLHKYFFNIQNYFPQIAYMEQARIRYEFPKLLGFISSGGGARSIDPITQSLGSQLQNELQYMNQRVIYMTSYAGFGAWSGDTTHSIGLPDAQETFSFTPAAMPDGSGATYTFTIQPHQYIYPSYFNGQTFTSTHQRTSPNSTCTFTIAENVTTSDSGMGICGINYISDLGDFKDKSVTNDFLLNGKRITKCIITYPGLNYMFVPKSITISSKYLTKLAIGMTPLFFLQTVQLSHLVRLREIDFTNVYNIVLPETHALKKVLIAGDFNSLKFSDVPNLSNIKIIRTTRTKEFYSGQNVGTKVKGFTVQPIVEQIYSEQKSQSNPALQSIHVDNVDWKDFDVNALSWFADRPTCEFKGKIAIKEDSTIAPTVVTWDLKNKFNAKFGCVDLEGQLSYKGLLLDYNRIEFNPDSATIKGNFYPEAGNTFKFEVRPSNIYENTQLGIDYYLNNQTYANIDVDTGILNVKSLSSTQKFVIIQAFTMYLKNGKYIFQTITKTIEIWNRPAQLGDLVYYDGTFSSVESYDGEKTPIGVCFYVPPRNEDGTINETFNNPNDKQLRLMVALKDVEASGMNENYTSWQWGAYPISSDEAIAMAYSLYDTKSDGTKVNLTSNKVADIYDIPSITNITDRGTTNSYIDVSQDAASTYRDVLTEEGITNDGFSCITPDKALGDGFGYNEAKKLITARTLTKELAALTGGLYQEGDIVNSGYAKTLKIIKHRNTVLNNDIIGADNEVFITGGLFPVPTASGNTSELDSLALLIETVRKWATDTLQDANPNKWSQLLYPAVSACYAYEPKVGKGEVLSPKFTKHHWWLATEGQMARICWYTKYGTLAKEENRGSNIFEPSENNGILTFRNTSSHWSSTEYYGGSSWYVYFDHGLTHNLGKYLSHVARAVSAF